MKKELKLVTRQCEKCDTVVYLKKEGKNVYRKWADGACQCGMSEKYPSEIAGYCKHHSYMVKNP